MSQPAGEPVLTRPAWQFLLVHVALLLGALLLGLIVGQPWPALVLALALMLAWQMWRVLRFEYWLRHRTTERPPNASGLWGDIVATTSRIYRRKVFHKRRVLVLLREFRRMTSAMPDGAILLGPNREILWFNRTAGHWLRLAPQGRLRHPHRQPGAAPGLRRVPGQQGCLAVAEDPAAHGRRALADVPARHHQHDRPATADRARRQRRGAPGVDAQGLRRQCLARVALATDRDRRLPRLAGRGARAGGGLEGAGRGDASAVRAHARHRAGPARTLAARGRRRGGRARCRSRSAACSR